MSICQQFPGLGPRFSLLCRDNHLSSMPQGPSRRLFVTRSADQISVVADNWCTRIEHQLYALSHWAQDGGAGGICGQEPNRQAGRVEQQEHTGWHCVTHCVTLAAISWVAADQTDGSSPSKSMAARSGASEVRGVLCTTGATGCRLNVVKPCAHNACKSVGIDGMLCNKLEPVQPEIRRQT